VPARGFCVSTRPRLEAPACFLPTGPVRQSDRASATRASASGKPRSFGTTQRIFATQSPEFMSLATK